MSTFSTGVSQESASIKGFCGKDIHKKLCFIIVFYSQNDGAEFFENLLCLLLSLYNFCKKLTCSKEVHYLRKVPMMKAELLIQSSWFYLAENEKNKKNWFLYEFSLKLFDYLKSSRNKTVAKWVAGQSEKKLAEYCAYFAKRMRNNTSRHLYRDLGGDIADDEYNRDYCHFNTQFENEVLAKVAEAAWLDLLDSCSICSTNCLNEDMMPCYMFDKMESGGKPW